MLNDAVQQGGGSLESQLATYLQSLATGLLVFTSIIGAYLSVHYGNTYNALVKAHFKLINLQKEMLDKEGSRESIIKNARLVEAVMSNYAYAFLSINNVLSQRMRKGAKYILLLAIFVWFISLLFIAKQNANQGWIVFFVNNDVYAGLFCFVLTVVAAMLCWSYLFKNNHMFDEFPNIKEQLDVSKNLCMFDVMLYSSLFSIDLRKNGLEATIFFSVPYSGFKLNPKVKYKRRDKDNNTKVIFSQSISVDKEPNEIVNMDALISAKKWSFVIPSKEDIDEIDIFIEVETDINKGIFILNDISWEKIMEKEYVPNNLIIMRTMTREKLDEEFGNS